VAAAVAGAALGAVGGLVPAALRATLATLLALVALVPASLELAGRRCRLPQRDRETPRRWTALGSRRWALRQGATLGVGAGTRIGFAAWYAVPCGCLLLGSPAFGAILYGLYGLTRTAAVVPIMVAARADHGARITGWLFSRRALARRIVAGNLLVLAVVVAYAAGV
jgi:hypothetical protein